MPLDPQVAELLEQMASTDSKPFATMTPSEARRAAADIMRLASVPEPVAGVEHRFIPGPTADLPVRIYRPTGDSSQPAIVYYHGGGFVMNTLEHFDPVMRALANRSACVIVAVNYQKSPEHKFPIPLNDCFATLQWTVDHAHELGIDPGRVGVAGDSAGANLAAAVCLRARDGDGPSIAHQTLICPMVEYGSQHPSIVAFGKGHLLDRDAIAWCWNQYLRSATDGSDPLASPAAATDLSALPPTLVITAEYDPLRDEGEAYALRLRAAGVPVTLRRYDGLIHGFFVMTGAIRRSTEALDEIGADIAAALGSTVAR